MQNVYLTGNLSKFGEKWEVKCSTIGEVFRLISCQEPGFQSHLLKAEEAGLGLEIVKGKELINSPFELFLPVKEEDIIISETPVGSKKALPFILLGAALFIGGGGLAVFKAGSWSAAGTAFSNLGIQALIGLNLVVAGLSVLLAAGPETEFDPNKDETPGQQTFAGPVNTTKQNVPIPVLYGELIVGGVTINGGFYLDDSEVIIPKETRDENGYYFNQKSIHKVNALLAEYEGV